MTDRCEQKTKAGGDCLNSVSYTARPPLIDAGHSDLRVCGVHANSLWADNWKIRDSYGPWQQQYGGAS